MKVYSVTVVSVDHYECNVWSECEMFDSEAKAREFFKKSVRKNYRNLKQDDEEFEADFTPKSSEMETATQWKGCIIDDCGFQYVVTLSEKEFK